MASKSLIDRYRGCLVGALIGDCLGSNFESSSIVNKDLLNHHFDCCERNKGEHIYLTDDTQMTQELADSLIHEKTFNAKDLARRFSERYFSSGRTAGYGQNVVNVFLKLRESNYSDALRPAREQFKGTGSYGNGAAMRIAPVALFSFPDFIRTAKLADQTSTITHTHIHGRHGAVLQALAIRRSLLDHLDNSNMFLFKLMDDVRQFGICQEYLESLDTIQNLLSKENVTDSEIEDKLGNEVSALRSVPTALFCFLRSMTPIPEIPTENLLRRAVEYAISLGGDTDTIASMAGALAGAQYGLTAINANLAQSCPDYHKAVSQADQLFSIVTGSGESHN